MAYDGLINLYLGETPKTTNSDVWNDMIEVYRAIHLLNAGFGEYSKTRGSGGPDKKPWEALAFERWFYEVAAEDITAGSIVTSVDFLGSESVGGSKTQYTGIVRGAPMYALYGFSGRGQSGTFTGASAGSGLVGVALEDCKKGALCKVGIGPAILKVEGIKPGDTLMAYAFASYTSGGSPAFVDPVITAGALRGPISKTFLPYYGAVVVGYGVATDSAMILPYVDYKADLKARALWDTPYSPVAGDSP